jgi:multifunctional beta-oxidation protein
VTRDIDTGDDVFYNESSAYIRGAGGFSDFSNLPTTSQQRRAAPPSATPPSRKPDAVRCEPATEEQAALYRLNGDRNAIHVDPATAHQGGFSRPILHGLCFFGISGKHVFQQYGMFRDIRVRFAGTVDPGQTLKTEMWREKDVVLFQTTVVETGKLCISGGRAELLNTSQGRSKL